LLPVAVEASKLCTRKGAFIFANYKNPDYLPQNFHRKFYADAKGDGGEF